MKRRWWMLIVSTAVTIFIALASAAVLRPRKDELDFLSLYKVKESTKYETWEGPDGLPIYSCAKYVTVKMSRNDLKSLLSARYSAANGWTQKIDPSFYGFDFRAARGSTISILGERIFFNGEYDHLDGEYIVLHQYPMTTCQVWILRLEHIGKDPFEHS